MNTASLLRFLEDFGPQPAVPATQSVDDDNGASILRDDGPADEALSAEVPEKKAQTDKTTVARALADDIPSDVLGGNALSTQTVPQEALDKAREEGARAAREELVEQHRAELAKAKAMLEAAAGEARNAEITALGDAVETLFAQYDSWLDHLFETSLRPLIAQHVRTAALEEFRSKLLESANRQGMTVKLAGPGSLVGELTELLKGHGLNVDTRVSESAELRAEIDRQCLETRLGRIDELLSSGLIAAPLKSLEGARDA